MNLISFSEKQFQHSSVIQLPAMDMVVVEREDPEIGQETDVVKLEEGQTEMKSVGIITTNILHYAFTLFLHNGQHCKEERNKRIFSIKGEKRKNEHTVAVVSAARGCTPFRPTTLKLIVSSYLLIRFFY